MIVMDGFGATPFPTFEHKRVVAKDCRWLDPDCLICYGWCDRLVDQSLNLWPCDI